MDQQSSARWLETLNREKRAKQKWQGKYLTPEEQQVVLDEEQFEVAALKENAGNVKKTGHLSERDAGMLRLASLEDDMAAATIAARPRPVSAHEAMRRKVAADVSASRPQSHRYTGDLSTRSLLKDIGPGMWQSVNPSYSFTRHQFTSASHSVHKFDSHKGWGERVDKEHHVKLDVMMRHADKCLQLGEKPFVSGGMKSAGPGLKG